MRHSEGRIVTIDANASGVSGDKYLGALVDLGAKPGSLRKVAAVVADNLPGTKSVNVSVRKVERGDIGAQLVTIESSERVDRRKGGVIRSSIQKCAQKLKLSDWGAKFSLSTVDTLLQAESEVHGHTSKEVALHELGSADTVVDVLGVAHLAEELRLSEAEWWSTPVAVGGGTTRFSGRTYPNPPPAVAQILKNHKFPLERGRGTQELSTPTGVAITVNLVAKYSKNHPSMKPEIVGYGAGSREMEDIANILRLVVGQNLESSHSHDQIIILETNVDDVTGEIIGRASERLMASGARDVTITPVYMKKNRPGHVISVLAHRDDAEKLADILIAETGTLGVRELPVIRHISPRKSALITVEINGASYPVKVKLSRDRKGQAVGGKLEYEDAKRISNQTGLSIRELQALARPRLRSLYG